MAGDFHSFTIVLVERTGARFSGAATEIFGVVCHDALLS
jgi:hypothetical protein